MRHLGIVGHNDVAAQLYDGLTVLQHRGQDAAGIATADGSKLRVHKGNGLVSDVFDASAMQPARRPRRHRPLPLSRPPVREGSDEAQPFYVNSPFGIALAHNGNLINTDALRREVFEQDRRNVNTESDSEVLLNVFAHELDTQKRARRPKPRSAPIEGVHRRCIGGYAVVGDGAGPGPGRVPRSARHPPAGAGQARPPTARTNTRSPPNRSRSTCSASSACATCARARRS